MTHESARKRVGPIIFVIAVLTAALVVQPNSAAKAFTPETRWLYIWIPHEPEDVFTGSGPQPGDRNLISVLTTASAGLLVLTSNEETAEQYARYDALENGSSSWYYRVRADPSMYHVPYSLDFHVQGAAHAGDSYQRAVRSLVPEVLDLWVADGWIPGESIHSARQVTFSQVGREIRNPGYVDESTSASPLVPYVWPVDVTVLPPEIPRADLSSVDPPAPGDDDAAVVIASLFTELPGCDMSPRAEQDSCSAPPLVRSESGAYVPAGESVALSQKSTPLMQAGKQSTATIYLSNSAAEATEEGATFSLRAPDGTSFSSGCTGWRSTTSPGKNPSFCGTLSNANRTLTITVDNFSLAGRGWHEITPELTADSPLGQTIRRCGSITFTRGAAVGRGTTAPLCYDPQAMVPQITQTQVPALTAGQKATATLKLTNNLSVQTPQGATFRMTAPTGTTFPWACVWWKSTTSPGKDQKFCGTRSNGNRTLTIRDDGFYLVGKGWHEITPELTADSPLGATERQCGQIEFTAGNAVLIGTTAPLCYDPQG